MDEQAFRSSLLADGFPEPVRAERPPGYELGEHEHPFDACALITTGEITLVVDGESRTYRSGEIFRLPAGTPHHERAGPEGFKYLVGRRPVMR